MKKSATVYWLLPSAPKRELFCEIIRILRRELAGPNFEPHLTLAVAQKGRLSPAKVLRQIRAQPVRLSIREIAFSAQFTKTLFVRFRSTPALGRLIHDLGDAAEARWKAPQDPHVSLLYKRLPRDAQREMARVIKLPFRAVTFDKIAAVRCSIPTKDATDVRAWRMIAKKSLR